MKYALILGIFTIFYLLGYALLKERTGSVAVAMAKYGKNLYDRLYAMFFKISEVNVRRIVLFSILLGGVIGFFLPGKLSEFESRLAITQSLKLNKAGNYEEAVAGLVKLRAPDSPIVHNELGVAYLGMRNYDSAVREFKTAIRLLPNYSKPHLNLARAYNFQRKEIEASLEFTRAQETAKYPVSDQLVFGIRAGLWDNIALRLFLAALMAFLGYKLPDWVIMFLRSRRMKKFDAQLPDGLIMASNGLRAGLSLLQTLEIVSRESPVPLGEEFGEVLDQNRLGSDLDEALLGLYKRMPTKDANIFVNSVLILRETGGNLTEIFDTLAETMQERKRVLDKIKTMTAQGVMQTYMLAGLPIVLALILDQMNPEVISLLYTTPVGWMCIILMALMEGVGVFWMLKIVKIKV
ncbi:type II secretion system F family protein [Desulfococcaceae bacterium HSG7]|nr:type II secretion system F family protein [Desulfococcaceae bacterium HSG7]